LSVYGKAKSQLRYVGYWPDGSAPTNHPPELTVAAKRLAEAAIEELGRFGVAVTLVKPDGRTSIARGFRRATRSS
jgi:hypothetical protein